LPLSVSAGLHQRDQIEQQLLRTLDRECGDQQRAVVIDGVTNLCRQMIAAQSGGQRWTVDVAIGRFAEHVIQTGRRPRRFLQRLLSGAEIARDQNAQRRASRALSRELKLHRCRSQDMAGIPEARAKSGRRLEPRLELRNTERAQGRCALRPRVDRHHRRASTPRVAPIENRHFGLLDVPGIREQHGAKIARAARGMDRAGEAGLDQLRDQPTVVDMRMRQQHSVERRRIERERFVVERLECLGALEHPAIDQHADLVGREQQTRAGHGAGGAEYGNGNRHGAAPLLTSDK
jgi:hypothetical protein